jgi:hypothetical protein
MTTKATKLIMTEALALAAEVYARAHDLTYAEITSNLAPLGTLRLADLKLVAGSVNAHSCDYVKASWLKAVENVCAKRKSTAVRCGF